MGIFNSKSNPIDSRQRSVEARLAAIKKQIAIEQQRTVPGPSKAATPATPARKAPDTRPAPATSCTPPSAPAGPAKPLRHDPIFEPLDPKRLHGGKEAGTTPAHFNELGVRKYDLPALWSRLASLGKTSTPSNPQLVNYLAAGSVHGLRAMRYEKRVARRRFIVFFVLLLVVLAGIAAALLRKY